MIKRQFENFCDMADIMEKGLGVFKKGIEKEADLFPEEMREDMFLDDYLKYRDEIPNIFYGALFLSVYAYMEFTLSQWSSHLCFNKDQEKEKKQMKKSKRKRLKIPELDKSVGKLTKYLTCPLPELLHDSNERKLLKHIRDAFAHSHGYMTNKDFLRRKEIINMYPGISTNTDDRYVVLEFSFIQHFLKRAEQTLCDLLDALRDEYEKQK